MKMPAMQFYPGDWRRDPGVQALTYEERGIWFEILCLMHECEPRGKLVLNGRPIDDERLARMLGVPYEKISQPISQNENRLMPRLMEGLISQPISQILNQLVTLGVASRDENGALVCRRMVRDEAKRSKLSDFGKKGGNPAFAKGKDNPYHKPKKNLAYAEAYQGCDKPNISPSSSSSSSSSDIPPYPPLPAEAGLDLHDEFETVWAAYPAKGRIKRPEAERQFCEWLLPHMADEQRAMVDRLVASINGPWPVSQNWVDGYIPALSEFIRLRRFDEEPAAWTPRANGRRQPALIDLGGPDPCQ